MILGRCLHALFITLWLAVDIMAVSPGAAFASEPGSESRILVLYKERDPDHAGLLQIFTSLLGQAGYAYDSLDVERLLVEKPDMSGYSGILTVYQTSQMVGGDLYPAWLVEQMEAGRRVLIVGSYGAYQGIIAKPNGRFVEWNESTQTINTFFHPFGLEFHFAFTGDRRLLRLVHADREYAQYQDSITEADLHYYQLYKSVNPDNRIYFGLERTDMLDSQSAFNVITPFGGMILEGYSYYWDPQKKKTVFRVNFPKFMKEVFSGTSPPVPTFDIESHAELVKAHPLPERAAPKALQGRRDTELPRHVLVAYKRSEAKNLEQFPFYNRAGLILEYLGLIPVYRAVEDGLPTDSEMKSFRGIVSWNTKPHMYRAEAYGDWLLRQLKKGKRLAILQEYGASIDLDTRIPSSNQAAVMEALGIDFVMRGEKREEYAPKLRVFNEEVLSFERAFNPSGVTYDHSYASKDPRNEVFLSFRDREFGHVDLGVITQNGGISLGQTPFYFPAHDQDRIALVRKALSDEIAPEVAEQESLGAWYLDPYWFLSSALGTEKLPAPDVTTLNGSRIFYAHIDGDGLSSISLIDGAHTAGFMVYEEILKKYLDIPTSVSVITKFVERTGNKYHHPSVVLSRNMFALPNVDMAVHAATHPFDWVGGDPYIVDPDSYPYEIGYRAHDLLEEIWGAKLFADHNLAPPGKKVTSLFWSGATNPDERALEIVWRGGMHNLNGGDPRFDDEYPSLAGLVPYSLPYSPYRQYLTSAQNDYIYTLFLTGDWGGQKKLLKHFESTDRPHRVYPMNLYYHFYSGIKNESMDALRVIYDYIRSVDAASMFATEYLEIVEDNYATRVGFDGEAYWVENRGQLRTLRFDRPVHVDIERSEGVVGYASRSEQTYVHLDGSKRRRIVLAADKPRSPYFIQATQFIDRMKLEGTTLRFSYRGFGKALLRVGGLEPDRDYRLTLTAPGRPAIEMAGRSNSAGVLEYRTMLDAPSTTYEGTLTR